MFFMPLAVVYGEGMDVKIVKYDISDGLLDTDVSCGLQDYIGYIWFSTHDGLVRYDGSSFKTYKAWVGDDCPLLVNRIDFIGEDSNHDILCYSDNRHFRFRRSTAKFEKTSDRITDARHLKDNDSSMVNKLKKLDEYKNIRIKVRLVDNQGGIWVSSNRGLERVVYVKKKAKTNKDGNAKEEIIRGLMCDGSGRIWVSDKNGYVRIYNHLAGRPLYLRPDGTLSGKRIPFGYNIYKIFEDSRGRIWLGAKPGGLFLLRPAGKGYALSRYQHESNDSYGISGDFVYSVAEDRRKRIWIGTYGGGLNLVRENKDGSLSFINKNNLLRNFPDNASYIHGMDINKHGVLILGTNRGLYTCSVNQPPERMRFYHSVRRLNDKNCIGANNVLDVVCSAEGSVYVATSGGGISKVISKNLLSDNLRFVSFTSKSGLATDVYLTLASDRHSRLWGVGKTTLTGMSRSGKDVVNYQKGLFEDGLVFSEVRPLCLPAGGLLFGTTQGLLHLDPNEIKKSNYVPKIAFDCPDYVELQPGESNVRIEFAALDFNRNEPIMYKYLLEGVDTDWHYTKENHIDYTNFPIGTYRLRVASTNSDGIWVDNENAITIKRRAAFHEMWYSWMLYGVLLVLSVIGVYKTARYIFRLKKEMSEHRKEMDLKLDYLDNRVKELMNVNSDIAPEPEAERDDGALFAGKAKDFVLENISNPDISVDDFARYMNISSSLLYIKCKKNLGYTPNRYIQVVRIKYATKIIMKNPDASVSDIAYKCGFSDPKYFSRCFKKIMGCNPKEYKSK